MMFTGFDESFDLVLSVITIHEMPPVVRSSVMKEAKRVLKKNGRYIIYEYNVGEIQFPQIIFKRAESLFFEILAGREHFKNYREYMAKGLQPYIKECGFIIEREKIVDPGENTLIMLKKEYINHMIHPYDNSTQTRWDRGEFNVQLNQPNNPRPIGFCDGSPEDVTELLSTAEAEGLDDVTIHKNI